MSCQATTITENDQFLLLACDGLFDVFSPEDVVQFVRSNIEKHGDAQKCCQVSYDCCCHCYCCNVYYYWDMITSGQTSYDMVHYSNSYFCLFVSLEFNEGSHSQEKLTRQRVCHPDHSQQMVVMNDRIDCSQTSCVARQSSLT